MKPRGKFIVEQMPALLDHVESHQRLSWEYTQSLNDSICGILDKMVEMLQELQRYGVNQQDAIEDFRQAKKIQQVQHEKASDFYLEGGDMIRRMIAFSNDAKADL